MTADERLAELLVNLRDAIASAQGVPQERVQLTHASLSYAGRRTAEANFKLRDLVGWAEETEAMHGRGAARVLLGAQRSDRLLAALRVSRRRTSQAEQDGRMNTPTLVTRLRSLADFLDGADFAVSWLYVDPTPDGPAEARTVHTVELDGQNGPEVTTNLDAFTDTLAAVESLTAEASLQRFQIEALGTTADGTAVRGLATYLEPAASALAGAYGLDASTSSRSTAALTLGDLEHLPQIVAAPEEPSSTPQQDTAPPTPSPTDSGSEPSPTPSATDPTPSPDSTSPQPDSSTGSAGSVTPSAPSAPDSEPTPPAGDTSSSAGTETPPATGGAAGGLSTRSVGDSPTATPSPDPTSTAVTGNQPAPAATGQQPGTPDGALTNADGTPVEPTAGLSADVGPDSSATPSLPDPTLPGQVPIQVDSTPVDSGASPSSSGADSAAPNGSAPTGPEPTSGADSSGLSADTDRAERIAALRAELAALETPEQTKLDAEPAEPVAAVVNTDPEPEGGQNLASGQGGGPSGDPAGGGYVTGGGASSGTADGY